VKAGSAETIKWIKVLLWEKCYGFRMMMGQPQMMCLEAVNDCPGIMGLRWGERERESDVGLLLMKALVLERKVETVVVRLAGNWREELDLPWVCWHSCAGINELVWWVVGDFFLLLFLKRQWWKKENEGDEEVILAKSSMENFWVMYGSSGFFLYFFFIL